MLFLSKFVGLPHTLWLTEIYTNTLFLNLKKKFMWAAKDVQKYQIFSILISKVNLLLKVKNQFIFNTWQCFEVSYCSVLAVKCANINNPLCQWFTNWVPRNTRVLWEISRFCEIYDYFCDTFERPKKRSCAYLNQSVRFSMFFKGHFAF